MKTPEPDGVRPTALQRVSDGRPEQANGFSQNIRAGGLPALILSVGLIGAFILEMTSGGPLAWGLSRTALAEGRWQTLGLHAVAHGGLWHLALNISALQGFTPPVRKLLGGGVLGWARYFVLLTGAAACSAAAYLLLHPDDGLPMVGASGALCGLWGLLVRCDPRTGDPRPLASSPVLAGLRDFAVSNLFLFGVLFLATRAVGSNGGLAWEAHLGGFVFGLLLGPFLLAPSQARSLQPDLNPESKQSRKGIDWRLWRDWILITLFMTAMMALQARQAADRQRDEASRLQIEADIRREVLAQASDLPDARILSFQSDGPASAVRVCGWVYLSAHAGAAPFHAIASGDPGRAPFVSLPRTDATDPQEWALEVFRKQLNLLLCDGRYAPPAPAEAPQPTLADRLVGALWEPGIRDWAIISPPSGGYLALRRRVGGGATVSPVFAEYGLAEAWTRQEGADLARQQDEEGRKRLDALDACLERRPVGDPERENC